VGEGSFGVRRSAFGVGRNYAIGVGSNRGDRIAIIEAAAELVNASGVARVGVSAPLVDSAPVGGPGGQGGFKNGAWIVETGLGPHQLLALLQRVETALGRTREVRWGARTLDLDILLRDDGLVVSSPVLAVPHPRLHERAFVLQPLVMIAGDWLHPTLKARISTLLSNAERRTPNAEPSLATRLRP
jgi:2-amino-4-hydroxy-6-hydroxymethyldihydropteridine diphosphokinase